LLRYIQTHDMLTEQEVGDFQWISCPGSRVS
jgi:hypothetical protein